MPHLRFSLLGVCLLAVALLTGSPGLTAADGPRPPGPLTVTAPVFSRGLVARRNGRAHDVPPPLGAATLGLKGAVGLRVSVAASGQVGNVAVSRSSGSAYLDVFAREWVRHVWTYPGADRPRTMEEAVCFAPAPGAARREADSIRDLRAVIPDTPRPVYPYVAMLTGARGRVELALDCGPGGTIQGAEVIKGSGSALLDESTAAFVQAFWRLPGQADRRGVKFIVTYQLH